MLEEYDNGFKEFFLLEFTRCLIEESIKIQDVVMADDERISNELKDRVKTVSKKQEVKSIMSNLSREKKNRSLEAVVVRKNRVSDILSRGVKRLGRKIIRKKPFPMKMPSKNVSRGGELMIDEPKFPKRLQYIKPVPTSQYIELGKLNNLIRPPLVKQIDCNGARSEIIIRTNRSKKINVTLTEDEINSIIRNFSVASHIPLSDGVFRAAVGNVEIVAMVSESVGSKFIIRKLRSLAVNRFGRSF